MTRTKVTILAAALGLAFGATAQAEGTMTKSDHASAKAAIEADYKAAKNNCEGSGGNAKDICEARAKHPKFDKSSGAISPNARSSG